MDMYIVSESPSVPAGWFGSRDGLSAIKWLGGDRAPCRLVGRDVRSMAVRVGDTMFITCYCSPNVPVSNFLAMLDELELTVGEAMLGGPSGLVLSKDFNAKSPL